MPPHDFQLLASTGSRHISCAFCYPRAPSVLQRVPFLGDLLQDLFIIWLFSHCYLKFTTETGNGQEERGEVEMERKRNTKWLQIITVFKGNPFVLALPMPNSF